MSARRDMRNSEREWRTTPPIGARPVIKRRTTWGTVWRRVYDVVLGAGVIGFALLTGWALWAQ